jgi:hypothetical protein
MSPRVQAWVRIGVYFYFAVGAALVANGVLLAIWLDFGGQADRFPAALTPVTAIAIYAALAGNARGRFDRPMSPRRWIVLCLLVSVLGFLPIVILVVAKSPPAVSPPF